MTSTVVEKVCEPNGKIVYRLTIKQANGSTKIENYDRAFDAQKRQKQIEGNGKIGGSGDHYS